MRMHISIETDNMGQIQAVAALLGGMNVAAPATATIVEETASEAEAPAATEAKRRGRPPKAEASATTITPEVVAPTTSAPVPATTTVPAAAATPTAKQYVRTDLHPYGLALMTHDRNVFKELLGKFGIEKLGKVADDQVQAFGEAASAKCAELGLKVG